MLTPVKTVDPTYVHRRLWHHGGTMVERFGKAPWWAQALIIWCVSRIWAAVIFYVVDRQAPDGPWGPTPLGYFDFMSIWDGQWYQRIHDEGYPQHLPRDASGTVEANAWAFYPVFPLLVKAITSVTGLPWAATASTVALLAGFGAAVLIVKLFREFLPEQASLWALAMVAFGPASPIFQTAYAESLHLAMLAGAFVLVLRGKTLWAAAVILVMCLTRPAGVPFAAALGLSWFIWAVRDLLAAHRSSTLGATSIVRVCNTRLWLALWACCCALLWPAIAWLVTGEISAYTDTETAWRGTSLVIFEPWLVLGERFFGSGWGLLALIAVIGIFFLLISTRVVRQSLPPVVWMWVVCYAVYLLAFLHPQSSTFRMLIPLFVLAAPLAVVSQDRSYRIAVIVAGAAFQIVFIGYLWQWSPLPGGGDWPP